jgi:hypothetical protein
MQEIQPCQVKGYLVYEDMELNETWSRLPLNEPRSTITADSPRKPKSLFSGTTIRVGAAAALSLMPFSVQLV